MTPSLLVFSLEDDPHPHFICDGFTLHAGTYVEISIQGQWISGHVEYSVQHGWVLCTGEGMIVLATNVTGRVKGGAEHGS